MIELNIIRKQLKNEKGVALPMALSCILIVTILVMEFAFSQQLSKNLALNDYESLRAEYLAKSGINISLLKLKIHSAVVKSKFLDGKPDMLNMIVGIPIMYPISDEMMQSLTGGGEDVDGGGSSDDEDSDDDESEEKVFEGNFLAIAKAETGLNLNGLLTDAYLSDGSGNGQEIYKKNIDKFKDKVRKAFNDKLAAAQESEDKFYEIYRDVRIDDILGNIIDWVDKNAEATKGGYEDDYYQKLSPPYKAKNRIFDSMSEIFLIEGMKDDIFDLMKDSFSIHSENTFLLSELISNASMMKWLSDPELTDEQITEISEEFNKPEVTWDESVEAFEKYIEEEYQIDFNKVEDPENQFEPEPRVKLTVGNDINRYFIRSVGVFRRTTRTVEIVVDRTDDKHMVVLSYKFY
jgi:general secretion pathway protein K